MPRQMKLQVAIPALLAALALCGPAAAQDSYRAPVQRAVPMVILPKPEHKAAEPAAQDQAAPEKDPEPKAHGKFPNKDTAKNRRDYEMGTDSPDIRLGRDEKSGDTVMTHSPSQKARQDALDVPVVVVPKVTGR
jgi:hypothetical protein